MSRCALIRASLVTFVLVNGTLLMAGCATGPVDLADRAMRGGNFVEAITLYELALASAPDDPALQRRVGIAHLRAGNYAAAIQILSARVGADPEDGRATLYLGAAYEANDQVADAIELYGEYGGSDHREKIKERRAELMWQQNRDWARDRVQFERDLDPPDPNSVGVLALELQDPEEELDGLGDALSGQFVSDLAKIRSLKLVERLRLNAILAEQELGQSGMVTDSTAPRTGALVGARRLLSGSVSMSRGGAEDIRIDLGLMDVMAGDVEIVSGTGSLDALFEFEADMVFKVLDAMDIEPTPRERAEIRQSPTRSVAAFLAYGRGLEAERRGLMEDARKAFEEARKLDPEFSLPAEALETLSPAGGPKPVEGFIADLPAEFTPTDVSTDGLTDVLDDILEHEGPGTDRPDDIRPPPGQIRIGDPPDPPSSSQN